MIGAMGVDAAAAMPGLSAARESSGKAVQVQRSLASALGAAGPKAPAALPALRRREGLPRGRWAAASAIARIEDKR